ncbi:hypothetical protein OIU78_021666 [Salix suchowensis]|nr:hypothetical protein OIU78_021666 [Salix suchowensis]
MEMLTDVPQNSSNSTEDFLAELTNYLSNDEEVSGVDVDGKDFSTDPYVACLNTILLSSPNSENENHMPSVAEPESNNISRLSKQPLWYPHPEVKDGVICCVLNTEDTEIPCSGDIVFPTDRHPRSNASFASRNSQDAAKPNSLFVKELPGNNKSGEAPVGVHRDLDNRRQPHASSQMTRLKVMPERGLLNPVADTKMETLVPAKLKEEPTETPSVKHMNHDSADSSTERLDFVSDCFTYPQTNVSAVKQAEDAPAGAQNHQASHMKLGSSDIGALELVVNHSISDPAEPPIQSDDDVPYFSDIEAMILDMDLEPEDQDLYCSEEVSRYQHEDMKRAIIRLEQGAHSCMQRSIASHGAFAVIYGRHSKHYIKKPEVLLGRATEDVAVDIDLGREGRANKISRQQATINFDKTPGQSLSLSSGCLIEIRGMPFIFEINRTCVKQYLDSTAQKNQTQEHLV